MLKGLKLSKCTYPTFVFVTAAIGSTVDDLDRDLCNGDDLHCDLFDGDDLDRDLSD